MNVCRHRLCLAIALPLLVAVSAGAQTPAAVPGSRIALVAPAGFVPAANPAGFENPAIGGRITVSEMKPTAYAALAAAYTRQRLAASGITLLSRHPIEGAALRGFLAVAEHVIDGISHRRWALVFAHPELTGVVTVTVPRKVDDPTVQRGLVAALSSVRVVDAAADDVEVGLPFRMASSPRFAKARSADGRGLVFRDITHRPGDVSARLTVTPALTGQAILKPPTFAARLARSVDGLRDIRIEAEKPLRVDGMTGIEASGRCLWADTSSPCVLFHAMVFDRDGYVRFVGTAPVAGGEGAVRAFRRLVMGFRRAE